MLTARALAAHPDARRKSLRVIAFDPGPTPGTGLSRNMNPVLRLVWWVLASPVGRLVPGLVTPEHAGTALAALARSDEARDALWRDSALLTGLSAEV